MSPAKSPAAASLKRVDVGAVMAVVVSAGLVGSGGVAIVSPTILGLSTFRLGTGVLLTFTSPAGVIVTTETDTDVEVEPPALVQVKVYVDPLVNSLVFSVPDDGLDPLQSPEAVQLVGLLVVDQLKVLFCFDSIVDGVAVRLMVGLATLGLMGLVGVDTDRVAEADADPPVLLQLRV